jgi:pheromone a factor receptor
MRSELPICSFAAFILVLFPLPRQWRARNIATITAILWIAITNLIHGINSIIWSGNVEVKFLVWCDISAFPLTIIFGAIYLLCNYAGTKITLGSGFASPAAGFCIVYNLAKLASIDPSRRELYKRDRTIRDIIICVLLPLVYVLLRTFLWICRLDRDR